MRADNLDLAVAEQVLAVNFNGGMRLAATVLPDLQAGVGIAFVASVAAAIVASRRRCARGRAKRRCSILPSSCTSI